MNDILKWIGKNLLTAVFWVFVLSITVNGRSLFSHANGVLVQNTLVQTIDEELAELWVKIYRTAKMTFADESEEHSIGKM